jgi:hypothetical protein
VLTAQELGWLRPLLYRLPGEEFAAYQLCPGEDGAVLISQSAPISGLPFGLPLRRLGETSLFIPLRQRFVPDLPWPLLREALKIAEDTYTFITTSYRLDLPATAFSPLEKSLVADPARPPVKFTLQPPPNLPPLRWSVKAPAGSDATPASKPDPTPPSEQTQAKGWGSVLSGLFGRQSGGAGAVAAISPRRRGPANRPGRATAGAANR